MDRLKSERSLNIGGRKSREDRSDGHGLSENKKQSHLQKDADNSGSKWGLVKGLCKACLMDDIKSLSKFYLDTFLKHRCWDSYILKSLSERKRY